LLIRNQAALVEQIARNDRERLELRVRSERRQLEYAQWQREVKEWGRKANDRFDRIEGSTRSTAANQERDWLQDSTVIPTGPAEPMVGRLWGEQAQQFRS